VTIPGRKEAYRLIGNDGPIVDLLVRADSEAPKVGESIYCRHPFDESKRCYVKPSQIVKLHNLVWDGKIVEGSIKSIHEIREFCMAEVNSLRPDHKYFIHPTPYKCSLSQELYEQFHKLRMLATPVEEFI